MDDNNGFKERLEYFREDILHITANKFETVTGISNGTLGRLERGISINNLAKILKAYPNLNARWLVTGEDTHEDKKIDKELISTLEDEILQLTKQVEVLTAEKYQLENINVKLVDMLHIMSTINNK